MATPMKLQTVDPSVPTSALAAGYGLVAEMFVRPSDRDEGRLLRRDQETSGLPEDVDGKIRDFLSRPEAWTAEEYLETLELAPTCPPYLGTYLYDEPTTCRGAGHSERNRYMLEARALYRHFGLELDGSELPDFVPLVAEFLALSLVRDVPDRDAIRRYFLEEYVHPPLPDFRTVLAKAETPYRLAAEVFEELVALDLERLAAVPPWKPPEESAPAARGEEAMRTEEERTRAKERES